MAQWYVQGPPAHLQSCTSREEGRTVANGYPYSSPWNLTWFRSPHSSTRSVTYPVLSDSLSFLSYCPPAAPAPPLALSPKIPFGCFPLFSRGSQNGPHGTPADPHAPAPALVPLPVFHFLWALQAQLEDFLPFCPLPQLMTDILTSFLQGSTWRPSRPLGLMGYEVKTIYYTDPSSVPMTPTPHPQLLPFVLRLLHPWK